ncbi:MAG: HAD family hydrolase [Oscillospiraceae bacterium]
MSGVKAVVFDLGGTLMEYVGMPQCWVDFYAAGFSNLSKKMRLGLGDAQIHEACERLKRFNPRLFYREVEYTPAFIFSEVLSPFCDAPPIEECVALFFEGMKLRSMIYSDAVPCLKSLKEMGIHTAALTDLPSAMPDSLFVPCIGELLAQLDCYVSSQICGFRKPNPAGMQLICEKLGVAASEVLLVGDEEKDKLTAARAGCGFLRIDRKQTDGAAQKPAIRSLAELWEYFS